MPSMLQPPVMGCAGKAFEAGTLVIARSSANVEDLEGMSGAGLYDSLPNIPAHDPAALGKAVADVWAWLYTRRAVLTRRAAGEPAPVLCVIKMAGFGRLVPHSGAHDVGNATLSVKPAAVSMDSTTA